MTIALCLVIFNLLIFIYLQSLTNRTKDELIQEMLKHLKLSEKMRKDQFKSQTDKWYKTNKVLLVAIIGLAKKHFDSEAVSSGTDALIELERIKETKIDTMTEEP